MEFTTTACISPLTAKHTCLHSKLDNEYCLEYGRKRPIQYFHGDIEKQFFVIDLPNLTRSKLRKSYRSLVNKQDGVFFVSSIDRLKELHIKVSGRQTRNDRTWEIQQEMIDAGEAFVVELYHEGTLISAALFYKNDYCCYYACAASLKGINSHPVIWAAIEYCKEEGLLRFELGEKLEGTEKERNISKFKAGFGADLECRYEEL